MGSGTWLKFNGKLMRQRKLLGIARYAKATRKHVQGPVFTQAGTAPCCEGGGLGPALELGAHTKWNRNSLNRRGGIITGHWVKREV